MIQKIEISVAGAYIESECVKKSQGASKIDHKRNMTAVNTKLNNARRN